MFSVEISENVDNSRRCALNNEGRVMQKLKEENAPRRLRGPRVGHLWAKASKQKYLTLLVTRVLLAVHIVVSTALHDAAGAAHELDARSHLHL